MFQMVDTHFFKGTVPWGPCPAPFLASVTRQATILYAESSSTMLHNYVNNKYSDSQVHARCLRCQIVAVSFGQSWAFNTNSYRNRSEFLVRVKKINGPRTDQAREITHNIYKN